MKGPHYLNTKKRVSIIITTITTITSMLLIIHHPTHDIVSYNIPTISEKQITTEEPFTPTAIINQSCSSCGPPAPPLPPPGSPLYDELAEFIRKKVIEEPWLKDIYNI